MIRTMKKLIPFLFIAVLLSACGKYEEGPNLSLSSKKSRAVNDWTLSEQYDADGEQVSNPISMELSLLKDDTWTQSWATVQTGSGTWAFDEDNSHIVLTSSGIIVTTTEYEILRLKSKELWIKNDNGVEYRLIPQEGLNN